MVAIHLEMGSQVRLVKMSAPRDLGFAGAYTPVLLAIAKIDQTDDFVIATSKSHSVRNWAEGTLARIGIVDWEGRVATDGHLLRSDDPPILVGDIYETRYALGWQPTAPFKALVSLVLDDSIRRLVGASLKVLVVLTDM